MTYDAPHFSGTGMMDASQGEPEDYGSPPAVCFSSSHVSLFIYWLCLGEHGDLI